MSRARKKKEEMNGNSIGVLSSGLRLARNGAKASVASRSAAAAEAGADSVVASRPDPEVVAKPKRRTFTAEYKLSILQEAEVAATPGGVDALVRREGLYSSLLATWRRERANGILKALTPQKRGPKSKRNPMEEEVQKLRCQNAGLAEDLRKAHIIIDVQKKWLRCWDIRFRNKTRRRTPDGRRHRAGHRSEHASRLPRASHYRKRRASIFPAMTRSRPSPPRALGPAERETVLAHLHGKRFQDRSPAAVYATLLGSNAR
ncbi:MAG: transposase [Candidatus Acidiferrales bacterium]